MHAVHLLAQKRGSAITKQKAERILTISLIRYLVAAYKDSAKLLHATNTSTAGYTLQLSIAYVFLPAACYRKKRRERIYLVCPLAAAAAPSPLFALHKAHLVGGFVPSVLFLAGYLHWTPLLAAAATVPPPAARRPRSPAFRFVPSPNCFFWWWWWWWWWVLIVEPKFFTSARFRKIRACIPSLHKPAPDVTMLFFGSLSF